MTDIRGSEAARKRKLAARSNKENEKKQLGTGRRGAGEEEKDKRIEGIRGGRKEVVIKGREEKRREEKERTDGAGNGLAEAPKAVHMNTSLSISTRTEELCPMHDRYSQIQSRSGLVQSRSRTTASLRRNRAIYPSFSPSPFFPVFTIFHPRKRYMIKR